jgi:MFS family permease
VALTLCIAFGCCRRGGTLGVFNAIQSIGGLAALPFAALICDRLGRRNAIMIGSTIMLLATAV